MPTSRSPVVKITRPARRRPVFHPLRVAALDRLTDDALAITFEVPERLRPTYAFQAGQHVAVTAIAAQPGQSGARPGDGEVRRSYSICSTPMELARHGTLRIGVKELPGGAFSQYAAGQLAVGDAVGVLPPLGHFTTGFDPARRRRYAGIVAGSGVTPVLSLIATGLAVESASTFTLLYGNRYTRSVMFADELAGLRERWPDRLRVVHVLSREPGVPEPRAGRIDADRLPRLLAEFVSEPVDEWFLCGPYGMITDVQAVLAARGVPDEAVRTELFHVPAPGDAPRPTAP